MSGKNLRVVIAGLGLRGTSESRFIHEHTHGMEIAGLVDVIGGRAELTRDYLEIDVPCFTDTGKALDAVKPDALMCFTTDCFHTGPVEEALKRNINVFCEKPMAVSLADCDRMIAAAKKSDAVFYMGFNMRHSPFHRTAYDIIQSGEIGDVLAINAAEYYYGGRTYFRRWNRHCKKSGGLWLTKTSHDFDLVSWLAGSDPEQVYALGSRRQFVAKPGAGKRCSECPLAGDCVDFQPLPKQPDKMEKFYAKWHELGIPHGYPPVDGCLYTDDTDTIDHGISSIKYKNGVCATVTLSVVTTPEVSRREMTIVGTKGMIQGDTEKGLNLSFRDLSKAPRRYDLKRLADGGHGGADPMMLADFVRTIREKKSPRASWADGRRSVEIGLAATQSMKVKQAVNLPL
jgi:predicted dehydrogenase